MFTQCPQCDTIFQLSVNQLRAANGDVRCGQCLSVFNALDHLSEDVPPTQEAENLTQVVGKYHDRSEEIPDNMTGTDEPAAESVIPEQTDAKIDNTNDVFSNIISEVKGHDIPAEEIDRFEAFLATDTFPAEDFLTINDSLPAENLPSTGDTLLTETAIPDAIINTDVDETPSSDIPLVPADETNISDINTDTATPDTDINFNDDEFAEFDVYLDGVKGAPATDTTRYTDKMNIDNDKIIIETKDSEILTSSTRVDTPDTVAPEENPQTETAHTTTEEEEEEEEKEQPPLANETQTINIPSLILDDLHAARAEQLRPSTTPWIIGSLLLMFTLILQVVYYSRDELARDTSLRPWLVQACEVLNCTLRQPYDIKQIEIIGRDVRSHPSADKALIVSTTLINNATFVQPFPLLTMVFSNINGTKIAQRRFTPREYLSNMVDLASGMTPDMPIRIDLELVDPGKAAVNYEFYAEADPRQTHPLS